MNTHKILITGVAPLLFLFSTSSVNFIVNLHKSDI